MKKAVQHLSQINVQDDYETPPEFFKWACNKFKIKPKLDVCGSKRHHKTPRYFTKDALAMDWKNDFWMNPPYSMVAKFIEKAYNESIKWNVNGLVLVYAKTDTKWFHSFVKGKADIYFIEGRIKFWVNGKQTKYPSPYPSMIVVYRKRKNKKVGMID